MSEAETQAERPRRRQRRRRRPPVPQAVGAGAVQGVFFNQADELARLAGGPDGAAMLEDAYEQHPLAFTAGNVGGSAVMGALGVGRAGLLQGPGVGKPA